MIKTIHYTMTLGRTDMTKEEELRLEIARISIDAASRILAAAIQSGRAINEVDYFGIADDIYTYVKTGKKPKKIKVE